MLILLKVDRPLQQLSWPQRNDLPHLLLFCFGLHLAGTYNPTSRCFIDESSWLSNLLRHH